MSQKRFRSINWDEEEKLFRSVLKEYAQIIENKSVDTNTNKLKINAWEQVHIKFNELNSRSRDLNQLKIQWKTMKINARKTCSTFKKEVNKTGGGARPATPNEAIIEIKDLLNPAELLIDHNIYDSDGVTVGELEPTLIDSKHVEKEQSLPLLDTAGIKAQIIQEDATVATPIAKKVDSIPAKDVKRKIPTNNIVHSSKKPKKDHEDYVNNMLRHSKMLKDDEHLRKMEMAEEEHKIKMEIHREKLQSAILEREILELKKAREVLNP
ncbi:uncharacterized protein LOC125231180 isoform X2 [Leguminivora glycinivorella]|uniref:uncharacterized protein LOC125229195 isoform X2 n=1 Tax=Leguminivora glycinivorella TaxID=1035111 RepID=UPI00200C63A8|nr:uncharacterized protein LOC125229195 isoform X2 [Leguminivora glycinivorella]XP_047992501.1 uncharacterized protein LOC125231180 isoform X2 [Leguminivora glycinivorella]